MLGGNFVHEHKTTKFEVEGERLTTKYIQISWTDQKELHCIKTQPIFSEAFQTGRREPFDFPSEISGFPM